MTSLTEALRLLIFIDDLICEFWTVNRWTNGFIPLVALEVEEFVTWKALEAIRRDFQRAVLATDGWAATSVLERCSDVVVVTYPDTSSPIDWFVRTMANEDPVLNCQVGPY